MFQSRKFYVSLLGAVAWSSTAADTVLSILEAASFTASHVSLVRVAAAASVFNLMSLCCIGICTYQHVRRNEIKERSSRAHKMIKSLVVLMSTVALVISLALIILIKSRWNEATMASSKKLISSWNGAIAAQITMWVISCVSQAILYAFPLWHCRASAVHEVAISGPRDSVMSEVKSSRLSRLSQRMDRPQLSSSPRVSRPAPTYSPSSPSLQSFRESLRHVVRPVTSRTTLISRHSVSRDARGMDSQSMDSLSFSDGFDSWDTRDALIQTAPSHGPTLDPIPGSRPESPACALDGPFLSHLPEVDDYEELAPVPRMMPDISRPPSPAVSEGHIHPLFRTETSSPAPQTTPGTSIIASPLATQAIACPARPFRQMRSNSRPASPSILRHQGSFTRDRSTSAPVLPRSSSPPGRVMTPPIPDFVLNSSPRGSMSGSRRVNLQHSPGW